MHNIEYRTYDVSADKEDIRRNISSYVSAQTYLEGGSGISKIRWLDDAGVLDNEDAAIDYLKANDNRNYDCLAVRFCSFDHDISSPKLTELREKRKSLYNAWAACDRESYVATLSSAFVSCKHCGSRLNTVMIKRGISNCRKNFCPVCLEDLRPATALKKIEAAKTRYDKADAAMEKERKALEKKLSHQAKEKWLVKFEYHT